MKKAFQGGSEYLYQIQDKYKENYMKLYIKFCGFGTVQIIGGKDT